MITAVDTNVPLALLCGDDYADAAEAALRGAYQEGRVVITPVVYAELAADGQFGAVSDLDEFLADLSIQLVEPSREAVFRAGEKFQQYTDRRPDGLQCPSCGTTQTARCEDCDEELTPRQHVAADFLIGGHATIDADELLSFDAAFYGTYFPSLTVSPENG